MSKWRDEFYVTVYELILAGKSRADVAAALGVAVATFNNWCQENETLKDTVKRARAIVKSRPPPNESFLDYCYQRLPPDLRPLWEELTKADRQPNPERAIELLMADKGKRTRQLLFVHALTTTARWSASEALRRIGETPATLRAWIEQDPDFQTLMLTIKEMKKDYIEGAYFGLVGAGDSAAILFGMRTLNADRGYSNKVTVKHEHEGSVLHQHVDLATLDVDIDTKRKMLDAMRKAREVKALPAGPGAKPLRPAIPPELLMDDEDE